jgi:hypothetical protein
MSTLWHLARQSKMDRPVDSAGLRQLAVNGDIRETDLVRRSGSKRWMPAGKIAGLFDAHIRDWFYIADGHCSGPVSFRTLWKQAKAGHIQPDDLVWKSGHWRARPASKIVGLFPATPNQNGSAISNSDPSSTASQRDGRSARAKRSSRPHRQRRRRGHRSQPSRSESQQVAEPAPADQTVNPRRPIRGLSPLTVLGVVILIATAVLLLAARRLAPVLARNESAPAPTAAPEGSLAIGTDSRLSRTSTKLEDPPTRRLAPAPDSIGDTSQGEPRGNRSRGVEAAAVTTGPISHSGGLSAEDEARMGREVHELITTRHKVLKNNALLHRLERAAASLIPQRPGKNPPLQFTLLDSEESFAFSSLGGYVYVSRGLFHLVRNDSELQFILGCEIAHLDLRHLQRAAMANRQTAILSPVRRLYRQIAVGYSPDDVFAADAWSYRTLRQLGVPSYQMIAWLSPSASLEGAEDPRGSRRSPTIGVESDLQEVENYWRSLPPAADRYDRLLTLDGVGQPQVSATVRHPSH